MTAPSREMLTDARRLVVKVGTRVVTDDDGHFCLRRIGALVDELARVHRQGREVILVSSGAMQLGREALAGDQIDTETRDPLPERQAMAAVGQVRLMNLYQTLFERHGLVCGQVLLTTQSFEDRRRYVNLRNALSAMLEQGAVPIINENDVLSTEEIAYDEFSSKAVFDDNDRLSMLVATKLDADLMVLLTDVEGVFAENPHANPDAPLVHTLLPTDAGDIDLGSATDIISRGGMRSKADAGVAATQYGIHCVIASGDRSHVLTDILSGKEIGTWIPAQDVKASPARARWLAEATQIRGELVLDAGAVDALLNKGASLLPVGITEVVGDFRKGDVVHLLGPNQNVIGRGMIHRDAEDVRSLIERAGRRRIENHRSLIRRNNMYLEAHSADPKAKAPK